MHVSASSAVEPFYTSARCDQPVVLFRGRVDLVGTTSTSAIAAGSCWTGFRPRLCAVGLRGPASELATQSIMGEDERRR